MKIVVIGLTGLVGSKTVDRLRPHGHEVVAASPSSGVNTLTGEGLAIADIALEPARNGMVEIAGPKRVRFSEIVGDYLAAVGDARPVVADVRARYFGAELAEMTLVRGEQAVLGKTDLKAWLGEREG